MYSAGNRNMRSFVFLRNIWRVNYKTVLKLKTIASNIVQGFEVRAKVSFIRYYHNIRKMNTHFKEQMFIFFYLFAFKFEKNRNNTEPANFHAKEYWIPIPCALTAIHNFIQTYRLECVVNQKRIEIIRHRWASNRKMEREKWKQKSIKHQRCIRV